MGTSPPKMSLIIKLNTFEQIIRITNPKPVEKKVIQIMNNNPRFLYVLESRFELSRI